ncbi:MAG: fibronectin type III domain-containing protein, partial [Eubacterium sp.]|nr:fibronectin type III domain-containing protein [Eubacterium sp.]
YSGTVKKTFTIKPKATTLSSVTAKSKGFTAKWKKLTTQTTGYQIQYSTSSKFSSAKTVTVSKNSTTSKTVSKLKAKKKYYVRIRTYKIVGKTKIYSDWSKSKAVTTKK